MRARARARVLRARMLEQLKRRSGSRAFRRLLGNRGDSLTHHCRNFAYHAEQGKDLPCEARSGVRTGSRPYVVGQLRRDVQVFVTASIVTVPLGRGWVPVGLCRHFRHGSRPSRGSLPIFRKRGILFRNTCCDRLLRCSPSLIYDELFWPSFVSVSMKDAYGFEAVSCTTCHDGAQRLRTARFKFKTHVFPPNNSRTPWRPRLILVGGKKAIP